MSPLQISQLGVCQCWRAYRLPRCPPSCAQHYARSLFGPLLSLLRVVSAYSSERRSFNRHERGYEISRLACRDFCLDRNQSLDSPAAWRMYGQLIAPSCYHGRCGDRVVRVNLTNAGQAIAQGIKPLFVQVINTQTHRDPQISPCPVDLDVYDAAGNKVARHQATLPSGAAAALDVFVSDPNERVQLRAAGQRSKDRLVKESCGTFLFSVEIYDVATGVTTLIMSDPNL